MLTLFFASLFNLAIDGEPHSAWHAHQSHSAVVAASSQGLLLPRGRGEPVPSLLLQQRAIFFLRVAHGPACTAQNAPVFRRSAVAAQNASLQCGLAAKLEALSYTVPARSSKVPPALSPAD